MTQHWSDIWMFDASGERCFAKKAADDACIRCVTKLDRFQRQASTRFDIAYCIHDAHSPSSHDPIENKIGQRRLRKFLRFNAAHL